MRNWAVLMLIICFSLKGMAQPTSYGNFKVENQEIIYQHIFFEDTITLAKLADYYKTLPYISNVRQQGEQLEFDMHDVIVDYKKFQFTQVATPSIIQTGKYSGKVSVSAKDGKYRVTVRQLQLTGDIGYKKITANDNLTNYATRNNGTYLSPDWCKPNTLGLLDKAFTDKLQYTVPKTSGDDDW